MQRRGYLILEFSRFLYHPPEPILCYLKLNIFPYEIEASSMSELGQNVGDRSYSLEFWERVCRVRIIAYLGTAALISSDNKDVEYDLVGTRYHR